MNQRLLRDLVRHEVDGAWPDFARRHPRLAAAIDRTRLIDDAVRELADDPVFADALRDAAADERALAAAARLLQAMRRVVAATLSL